MTVEKVEDTKENDIQNQINELKEVVKGLQEENKTLKSHADEVIQEKRALKAKHEEKEKEFERQLAEKTNRTKDESEQLIKQYKEQNDKLTQEVNDYKQREYSNKVDMKARELADKLNPLNPNSAGVLTKLLKERIKLDDDGSVKVLDEKGNVTISPVDQLVSEFGTTYAFMLKGVESTGGGSHSSAGAQVKKMSEMSESEKIELYRTDPNKYRELRNQG